MIHFSDIAGAGRGVLATALVVTVSSILAEPIPFDGPATATAPGVLKTSAVSLADLNKDGRLDVVLLSGETERISVLLNETSGFRVVNEFNAGPSATGCATGDFNKDNDVDLAVSHHDTDEVWLFFGKSGGFFVEPKKIRIPVTKPHAHMLLAVDANGDQISDLLLAQADDNQVWLLLGNGKGEFETSPGSPMSTGNHPYTIAASDFDNDGKLDFATPNWYGRSLSIFLGDGKGNFTEAPKSPMSGFAAPMSLGTGDLTGDGNIDLAVGNDDSRTIQILAGDGKGIFAAGSVPDLQAHHDCLQPVLADLNADGKLDVVATAVNDAPSFSYWINLGEGKFSPAHALACPAVASRIRVADLNGNGVPDMFVGSWKEARSFIWFDIPAP